MANEKRLIDANAFKMILELVRQDYLEEDTFSSDFAANVIETVQDEYLANAPTVDAVEVVHGRWEHIRDYGNGNVFSYCSNCKTPIRVNSQFALELDNHYCRYCGAKMDGGNEDG